MIYNCVLRNLLSRHPVLILDVKVMENHQNPGIHTVSGKLLSLLKMLSLFQNRLFNKKELLCNVIFSIIIKAQTLLFLYIIQFWMLDFLLLQQNKKHMILSQLSKQDLTQKAHVFASTSMLELTVTGQISPVIFPYFIEWASLNFLAISCYLA